MTDPWVSGARQARLMGRFVAHWWRHLVRQPFQTGRPPLTGRSLGYRMGARVGLSVYDAVIDLMLTGYEELAGCRLRPETGAMTLILNRLLFAFDDEFERRLVHKERLDFDEVLGSPRVRPDLDAFLDFLAPYPERDAIRACLRELAGANFQRYADLSTKPGIAADLPAQLEVLDLDSAGFTVLNAKVIGLFHGLPPQPELLAEFAGLGMVGKIADDLVDVWIDLAAGVDVNVMLCILRGHPADFAKVAAMVLARKPPRTGRRWWQANCPDSFAELTSVLQPHWDALSAPHLRMAGGLMLIPAHWGGPVMQHKRPG